MDDLTHERNPDVEPRRVRPDLPVNRWGDTAADIKTRQAALERHWRDRK